MSKTTRGGGRVRRFKRDQKYTIGVDLAADGAVDATVMGYWRNAVFTIVSVAVRPSDVIEGSAVPVEKRPERLLDAGGSES